MPLSKKSLESFLWDRPTDCFDRGLTNLFSGGERYRRLNLLPYGTADLVLIETGIHPRDCFVQVVALTTGTITLDLYLRVKGYQTALRYVLQQVYTRIQQPADMEFSSLLIGREVEASGSFVHAFNHDRSCEAFCYSHDELTGIQFKEVSKDWKLVGSDSSRPLAKLEDNLFQALHQQVAAHARQPLAKKVAAPSGHDLSASLVVTATGIVDNQHPTPPAKNDGVE